MRETTALIYSPKLMTTLIETHLVFQLMFCVGGSLKNCHLKWGGGLANADVIRGVAQC